MPPPIAAIYTTLKDDILHLSIPVQHEAYLATRKFLTWDCATEDNRAMIPYHLAIYTFLPTSDLNLEPQHAAVLRTINTLIFNLTDEAWGRTLDELENRGAFTLHDLSRAAYFKRLATLGPTSDALYIQPNDVQTGAPFDEQPTAAARGRGRGGRGGEQPEVQDVIRGEESLRFLALTPITTLRAAEGPPLKLICQLAGSLGPCLSHL